MTTNLTTLIKSAFGIMAAIASAGFLALPTAHAAPGCTVPGQHLKLHHSSGYDATIESNPLGLGPTAVIDVPPELKSLANVSGGIQGRAIEFAVTWSGTTAFVLFTGTVGEDGVAHGMSTGIGNPVNLDPGRWDSTTRLTCRSA